MSPNRPISPTQILQAQEIAAILADCSVKSRASHHAWVREVVFRLSCCCGLRASEICGLDLRDAHLGLERPYLEVRRGKNGRSRRVPLWWDRGTLECLRQWLEYRAGMGADGNDPFVCTLVGATAGRLHRNEARMKFITACKCLGADRQSEVTCHTGRHSFCSHALAGGRTLAEVRDAAGHANLSTTSLYIHVLRDDGEIGDLFAF